MTAEEMFKEMGYEKYSNNHELIYATDYGTMDEESITFLNSCPDCFTLTLPSDNYDSKVHFFFSGFMIKAISKQIEELKEKENDSRGNV